MQSLVPVLRSTLTVMIPLLFAASGGLFPALAGTLNIALEGLLLAGAFSALAVFHFTGSAAMAVASAACAATALSALHAFTSFRLKANLFITGLAVNLLSSGLCVVLSGGIFNTRGVVSSRNISGLLKWYLLAALFLLPAVWLLIYKTPFGYRLRACDKNSGALVSLGINPLFYQSAALLISGFLAGIGGSFLSLNLGAFVQGMPAGEGLDRPCRRLPRRAQTAGNPRRRLYFRPCRCFLQLRARTLAASRRFHSCLPLRLHAFSDDRGIYYSRNKYEN